MRRRILRWLLAPILDEMENQRNVHLLWGRIYELENVIDNRMTEWRAAAPRKETLECSRCRLRGELDDYLPLTSLQEATLQKLKAETTTDDPSGA